MAHIITGATITTLYTDSETPGDFITNDNTLTFEGSITSEVQVGGNSGATLDVYLSGGSFGNTGLGTLIGSVNHITSTGTWSFGYGSQVPDGTYTISIADSGHPGVALATHSLVVDTTPPSKPTALDLDAADDTGSSNTDNLTKNTTGLTISGVAESAATVWLFEDADNSGSMDNGETTIATTTGAGGAFSADISLTQGTHLIRAFQRDVAGNYSNNSEGLVITVDTTAPTAAVAITAISTDSGTAGDFVTNDTSLTVSGTPGALGAGEKVQVSSDGGATWSDVTTSDATTWSFTDPATHNTSFTYQARIVDVAGNVDANTASHAVTIDTAAAAPSLALATDSGSSNSDLITKIGTVNVSGLETGATWQYSTDNGASWTAGSGSSFTLTGDGAKSVIVRQTDTAGNVSPNSSAFNFMLDTSADKGTALSVTASDHSINNAEKGAAGFTVAGLDADATADVTFTSGANHVTVHVTGNGAGSADLSGLSDGPVSVSILATDTAGNTAAGSGDSLTLDTASPSAGVLTLTDPLIDSSQVTAVPFTVTGLEADGSGIATFTDGTHTAQVNVVAGTTAYTVNLTGFGRNVTSSLVVADAAGNSAGPTAGSGGAPTAGNSIIINTSSNLVLLISEFNSIPLSQWQGNSAYATVTIMDLPANFAALTGAQIAAMAADGITAIGSSSGNLVLNVDQYTSLGSMGVKPPAKIVDTAAAIDGMSASEFAGMAGKNIKTLTSTTGPLTLSFDQYTNLNGVLLPSDKSTTLVISEATLEGRTAAQISAFASGNIGHISVPENAVNLGIDQFNALRTAVLDPAIALTVTGDVGGVAADTFTFSRQPFSAADKINGGGETDTLSLEGDYGTLAFNANTMSSVEKLKLNGGGHGYNITENDGNVAANQTLTVAAVGFVAGDSLAFDGSAETDGSFSFVGGGAGSSTFTGGNKADAFTAGTGADTIRYTSASQSNSSNYDTVKGFDTAADSFSWTHALTFDGTVGGQLKSTSFEANLQTAFSGVGANHAAIFQATSGNLAGQMFLLINDASVGYQTGDVVVRLTNTTPAAFSDANFKVG